MRRWAARPKCPAAARLFTAKTPGCSLTEPKSNMVQEEDSFRPWATWAVIAANLLMWIAMANAGVSFSLADTDQLVDFGGLLAVRVWQGEIWRIVTALFVHGAWWHFALNMFVFWQVGRLLERIVGAGRLLLIYMISGVFGFALSLIIQPGLTVGASGAVFGIVGALLGFATLTRGQRISRLLFSSLNPFVLASLLLGYLIPFVDNSAHIGGLVIGYLFCYVLLCNEPIPLVFQEENDTETPVASTGSTFLRKWNAAALLSVFTLFVAVLALSIHPSFSPLYATAMAWENLRHHDVAAAKQHADLATRLAPEDPAVLLLRGRMALENSRGEVSEGPRGPTNSRKANRFYSFALEKLNAKQADRAIEEALYLFVPLHEPDPMFFDEKTTLGLCNAALGRKDAKTNALVHNNCAWFFLKAKDKNIGDANRGLLLAQKAYNSFFPPGTDATNMQQGDQQTASAILHTLAEAHAQNGDPQEAKLFVQRIIIQGLSDDRFFLEEADRFGRLAHRKTTPQPKGKGSTEEKDPGESKKTTTTITQTPSRKEESAPAEIQQ
jgi:rhomboid protease GluP